MSNPIVRLSLPWTRVGSLDGLLARPPAAPPGLRPLRHLPLAGGGPGRLVPAPRSGRCHQPGAGLGACRTPAITACCISSIPRPWMWRRSTRLWHQTFERLLRPPLGAGQRKEPWCWSTASSGPRKAKRCRGSKACIKSPAAMPRLPLSWAIPSRPWRCLAQAAGVYLAVPVAARIHEGLVWSNRDRRTLLDKLAALLLGLAVGSSRHGRGRRLLRRRQVRPRPLEPGASSGHAGALQRRRLFPALAAPTANGVDGPLSTG